MNHPPRSDTPSRPDLDEIFAVDDDETDRILLQHAVAAVAGDHRCRLFTCGDDLIDALLDVLRGARPPLMCFIDVKMAGMGGLDVLRWIRAQPALRDIPVVMLSSSDAPDHLAEALQFGAQCYVAKFPGAEEMQEIVTAAKRHATAGAAFPLPCNLLLHARQAVS
jgi:CheY-like chemotaxis protein